MKKNILDVAARLIQEYGLKKFTIDEIATELKISKRTIYRYFESKDDIIRAYFDTTIASDKDSVEAALESDKDYYEKIHSIIHSTHQYRLPAKLLNESRLFYPEEWAKIEELKRFKLDAINKLLKKEAAKGILRQGLNFAVLSKMLEEISDMFIDYDFLLENKLKTSEAIDEALKIILSGILKQ
jgi:AcrR family transcriptional regulator